MTVSLKKNPKRKISVPWWNKACDKAVRGRNCAQGALRNLPTENRAIEYKRLSAKARRGIKSGKRVLEKILWETRSRDETSVGDIWWAVHC